MFKDTSRRKQSAHTRWKQCWLPYWHPLNCSSLRWRGRSLWHRRRSQSATGTPRRTAKLWGAVKIRSTKKIFQDQTYLQLFLVQEPRWRLTKCVQDIYRHTLQVKINVFRDCERLGFSMSILSSGSNKRTSISCWIPQQKSYSCTESSSHLSRLLVLGICFPARAHNSPSDGCLNLKRLRKPI